MSELFRKAKQNRVFQDVVAQVQDAILDGKLLPGAKLPPERELGEMLGTSRGTLREALRILEEKGLIEIRLGVNGGAIVKKTTSDQMSESLALLIRSQTVSLEHLSEFREGVEETVTRLAAKRVQEQDVIELQHLKSEAKKYYKIGVSKWDEFVQVDEKVHMLFARVSGNPLYRFILETIHDNIQRYYDKFLAVGENELEENYQDLTQMIDAVINQDIEEAGKLAKGHVRKFSRYMEQKIK